MYLLSETSLQAETKGGYLGKVKVLLKSHFNNPSVQPLWSSEEWYTVLLDSVKTATKRDHLLNTDERMDNEKYPFYLEAKEEYFSIRTRDAVLGSSDASGHAGCCAVDGKSLCHLLLRSMKGMAAASRGPAQQRVWFVLCALAVGRGGEIKFQRYDEWRWDGLFQNVDAIWSELKTLTRNP